MVTNGVTEDKLIQIRRNPWADNFFRPLLLTIMIMCLNLSLVNLVHLINPAWNGIFFLLGMLITTVEAIYSYRVLKHYRSRGISVMRYRLAEASVLIVLLKILSLLDQPLIGIWQEIQLIWQLPYTFVNTEFYILIILAILAWSAATGTIADFESLYDPYTDNTFSLDSLAVRFFWGGAILVVVSGMTQWIARAGARSLLDWQRSSLSGIIINVLIYFVLGLVLLGQVNLTTRLVRWRIQKIKVGRGMVKQWAKYGLVFLVVASVIAFLLPTHYTLGLLATAQLVVVLIISWLIFLVQLIILLIMLPLGWLLSLLGATPAEELAGGAAPPPPPVFDAAHSEAPPWLEILRSLFFWLVALGLIGYMIKSYLEDHPQLIDQLKRLKFMGILVDLLTQLWRQLTGWAERGKKLLSMPKLKKADQSNTSPTTPRWNWFGLRGQSPRQKILAYYLNILSRAEKRGLARQDHQTPFEYEPKLAQSIPTVEHDVQDLTDTFVRARYSEKDFSDEDAASVKLRWQKIRKALRKRN